ncbi:hypothetical protein [Streptosporangium sp. NPDC000396]|uniref:hypothetical protein n=1 Tax=Streptosporangium sp. NPDC000396 TaxID=3366185 RepID=UPI00367A206C
MLKSTKTIILAAALATGGIMANPAYAAAASYTPEGICGAGFARVDGGVQPVKTSSGSVYGHVYLLYNSSTGYNCVTTIKTSFVGLPTHVSAWVQVKRPKTKPVDDSGSFKYYAGPAKIYGKGLCVKFWGSIKPSGHDPKVATGGRNTWGNCD